MISKLNGSFHRLDKPYTLEKKGDYKGNNLQCKLFLVQELTFWVQILQLISSILTNQEV